MQAGAVVGTLIAGVRYALAASRSQPAPTLQQVATTLVRSQAAGVLGGRMPHFLFLLLHSCWCYQGRRMHDQVHSAACIYELLECLRQVCVQAWCQCRVLMRAASVSRVRHARAHLRRSMLMQNS